VSEAYNFTLSGTGEYEIEADTSFYILKKDGEVGIVHADSPADAPSTTVDGTLAVARRELDRRAQFTSCSASQQALLNTAFTDALSIAQNSLTYAPFPLLDLWLIIFVSIQPSARTLFLLDSLHDLVRHLHRLAQVYRPDPLPEHRHQRLFELDLHLQLRLH